MSCNGSFWPLSTWHIEFGVTTPLFPTSCSPCAVPCLLITASDSHFKVTEGHVFDFPDPLPGGGLGYGQLIHSFLPSFLGLHSHSPQLLSS